MGEDWRGFITYLAAEWNIKLAPLPKNMTDKLQVMDLVVNGPYKAGLRRERTASLFDYYQSWKLKRLQAERDKADLPPFAPPKPTVPTGLRMALKVGQETLEKPTFIEGMRRAFVAVGLSKQCDGTYVKYSQHCKGVMYTLPNSTIESPSTASLGEVAADLDLEPRAEAEDSEHESDEDSAGGDEMISLIECVAVVARSARTELLTL